MIIYRCSYCRLRHTFDIVRVKLARICFWVRKGLKQIGVQAPDMSLYSTNLPLKPDHIRNNEFVLNKTSPSNQITSGRLQQTFDIVRFGSSPHGFVFGSLPKASNRLGLDKNYVRLPTSLRLPSRYGMSLYSIIDN